MTLKQMILSIAKGHDLRQIIVFCCIGVFNTAFCFGMIVLLTLAFDLHHALANILGYAIALTVGFTLHSLITFSNVPDQHPWPLRFKKFLIVFAAAYAVQFCGLLLMIDLWRWPEIFSQFIACGIYTVFSYLGSKFYTFAKRRSKPHS